MEDIFYLRNKHNRLEKENELYRNQNEELYKDFKKLSEEVTNQKGQELEIFGLERKKTAQGNFKRQVNIFEFLLLFIFLFRFMVLHNKLMYLKMKKVEKLN